MYSAHSGSSRREGTTRYIVKSQIDCCILKLPQIYDIILAEDENIKYILRVPSPDSPVDKLSSEVATLQYIAANTSVLVPKVLAWSTDPFNSAGTEYMILEKVILLLCLLSHLSLADSRRLSIPCVGYSEGGKRKARS